MSINDGDGYPAWVNDLPGDDHDRPNDLHVVPVFAGEREHETSVNCWCRPRRDIVEMGVVIHERRAEA